MENSGMQALVTETVGGEIYRLAHMLILAGVKPLPLLGKAQVNNARYNAARCNEY